MAQLPPVQRQIGIFEKYMARGSETLVLKEKLMSLSGDSFDVKLANGQSVFKVQGRHMTVSSRKSVMDSAGNHIFDIVQEHFHIHTTYAIEDAQKNKVAKIKSSFKLVGSKATAEFQSRDGRSESLVMKGNWRDTSADIVCETTGAVVARIDRKLFNAREFFGGQQTYALIVAPGVDMALMVAMVVALDEANNES